MKNLRQRSRKNSKNQITKRRLTAEALEQRQLLAGVLGVPTEGLNPNHNYFHPTDVTDDGQTSVIDALVILNRVNQTAVGEQGSALDDGMLPDVNNDKIVSPLDALNVINAINNGEGTNHELVELHLDLTDPAGNSLLPQGSLGFDPLTGQEQFGAIARDAEVTVGDEVNLEIKWDDLRGPFTTNALGVFSTYVDILAGNSSAFIPILNETQRIVVDENLEDPNIAGGFLTLSMPGQQPQNVSFFTLINQQAAVQRIEEILNLYGFNDVTVAQQQRVTRGQSQTGVGEPFTFDIRFNDQDNVDVPNLMVTSNFVDASLQPVAVGSRIDEIPVAVNGQPNPDAFKFNLDVRSRNANNTAVYTNVPSGNFLPGGNADDATVLFDEVGGVGPINPGGITAHIASIPNAPIYTGLDFEAFSIRLLAVEPAAPFEYQLNLSDDQGKELAIYGRDTPVGADMTRIDLVDDPNVPSDGRGLVRITVVAAPQDITVVNDAPAAVVQGNQVMVNPAANDVDNTGSGVLEVIEVGNGAMGDVTLEGNIATYTPSTSFVGTDTFTYTVRNSNQQTASGLVTVTFTPEINDPPVAGDDTITVTEDTPQSFPISTFTGNDSDDKGIINVVSVSGNAVLNNNDNTITYTPGQNVYGDAAETFTYTIQDDADQTAVGNVTVNITPVNDPPQAGDDSGLTVDEGSSNNSLNVLSNDNPGPNETGALTIVDVTPGSGSVSISSDGLSLLYTPPTPTFLGSDSLSYTIRDTEGATDSATVSLTVVPTIRPRAIDDSYNIDEDSGQLSMFVLSNDLANPGQSPTLTGIDTSNVPSSAGTVEVNNNNTPNDLFDDYLMFNPASNFFGTVNFTYSIADTGGPIGNTQAEIDASIGTVTITVASVNDPPVFTPDNPFTVNEDTALNVNGNATLNDNPGPDNEGDTITIKDVVSQSDNGGSLSLSGNVITYQPAQDFNGTDQFTYTITDGEADATATATISVLSINDAPTVPNRTYLTQNSQPVTITSAQILDGATTGADNENQTLTVTDVSTPSTQGGQVSLSNGTITYTPPSDLSGNDTFTVTVTDNGTPAESTTATITVTNNAAPVANTDNVDTFLGTTLQIDPSTLLSNDTDAENDTLSITGVTNGTTGTATLNSDGTISYSVPAGATTTSDEFTYSVTDGFTTVTGTVNVNIQEFQPSSVKGAVFIDMPVGGHRNGQMDDGESGIGYALVTLKGTTATGNAVEKSVRTDASGKYCFDNLAPGNYTVDIELPDSVIGNDPAEQQITIGAAGGVSVTGAMGDAISLSPSAGIILDGFAASFLAANQHLTASDPQMAYSGIVFGLDADGTLDFVDVRDGFGDILFAEISLNDAGDKAMLSIVDANGDVLTVEVPKDRFIVTDSENGGKVVRVFGKQSDFSFVPVNGASLVAEGEQGDDDDEFIAYMEAVDTILAQL